MRSPLLWSVFFIVLALVAVACAVADPSFSSEDDVKSFPARKDGSAADEKGSGNHGPDAGGANEREGGSDAAGILLARIECGGSFERDVLPALGRAGCAAAGCHGTRLGRAIRIELGNPSLTYNELTALKLAGKPYVDPRSKDPTASSIQCHLAGQCGIRMPPDNKPLPPELAPIVNTWLTCGAPAN